MRRPPRGPAPGDAGTAVVEFTVLAVLVLLPLLGVALAVLRVQTAADAVATAAREAARAYATAADPATGTRRASVAARLALADHGLTAPAGALRLACLGGACLTPGSRVRVTIDLDLRVGCLPDALAARWPVHVQGTAVAPVDRWRAG